MAYVIAEPCIDTKDASCVEVCPVDCIETSDEATQYFINPDTCIDCGACVPECPVQAIFEQYELRPEWQSFVEINAQFFR